MQPEANPVPTITREPPIQKKRVTISLPGEHYGSAKRESVSRPSRQNSALTLDDDLESSSRLSRMDTDLSEMSYSGPVDPLPNILRDILCLNKIQPIYR